MLVWPGSLEKKAKRTTLYGQQVPARYDPWLSVPKTRSVIPKDSGAMVKKPQCEIYRKCLSNDSVFSTSFYLNLESATVDCYEYQPLGHSFSSSSQRYDMIPSCWIPSRTISDNHVTSRLPIHCLKNTCTWAFQNASLCVKYSRYEKSNETELDIQ